MTITFVKPGYHIERVHTCGARSFLASYIVRTWPFGEWTDSRKEAHSFNSKEYVHSVVKTLRSWHRIAVEPYEGLTALPDTEVMHVIDMCSYSFHMWYGLVIDRQATAPIWTPVKPLATVHKS